MKNLSQKQIGKLAEWYDCSVVEVGGYARFENGKVFDFQIHFADGSRVWLDASNGRGKYLAKMG